MVIHGLNFNLKRPRYKTILKDFCEWFVSKNAFFFVAKRCWICFYNSRVFSPVPSSQFLTTGDLTIQ